MSTNECRFREPLLTERIAALCGFDTLSDLLPARDVYPPYLFAGFFLVLDFGVVNMYKYLTGHEHILVTTPTVIAGPIGLILAAIGIRYRQTATPVRSLTSGSPSGTPTWRCERSNGRSRSGRNCSST